MCVFMYRKTLTYERKTQLMSGRVGKVFSYSHWVAIVLACPQPAQQICL